MRRLPELRLLAVGCVLLLAACQTGGGMPGGQGLPPPDMTIVSQKAPPAPNAETIPPPPAAAPANYFVWEPGHWHWTGIDYIWVSGHYIEAPYRSAVWVHGGWAYDGNLYWTWTPGHWN